MHKEASLQARILVQLLKQEKIGFDYTRFAYDLYLLQQPGKRSGVITRWSRDLDHHVLSMSMKDSKLETAAYMRQAFTLENALSHRREKSIRRSPSLQIPIARSPQRHAG